jgi:hypothetical protein
MLRILVLSIAVLLTGCASITGSQEQPISVQATQGSTIVSGASCTLSNDVGKWYVKTPGSVSVKKSTGDLMVECAKNDASGNEKIVSKANVNVWGNVLIGGLIGYAIDRNSGAGFDYPEAITIKLGINGSNGFSGAGRAAGGPVVADGRWRAVMSCDANRLAADKPAYQARFAAEVNGDKVTLHRKNAVAEEVLSGTINDDNLPLAGTGYRFKQSNFPWTFKFTGAFTGNGKIYTGNGEMLNTRGRTARVCTLVMIHTDVPPPVKDGVGEGQADSKPDTPKAAAPAPAAAR